MPAFVGRVGAVATAAVLAAGASGVPGASGGESPDGGVARLAAERGAAVVAAGEVSPSAVSREVVAVAQTAQGLVVTKLRAPSAPEAEALAATLDAEPGVTAEPNALVRLPEEPARPAEQAVSAERLFPSRPLASAVIGSTEPYWSSQWGPQAIGAEAAWGTSTGSGVVVAVVDTGVDTAHPDLAGRTVPQIDVVADGRSGDPAGHGTQVAGIVVAGLNRTGIAGVAPAASVLPVRVLDGGGLGDVATVASGIVAATDSGADVINLSLGGPAASEVQERAVRYAVDAGVVVVAAAGNSRDAGNPTMYPAAYDGVVAVSSMARDGSASDFANTGWYLDLIAPGEGILSTVPAGRYAYGAGTSMAAPHVSAVAALVLAARPTLTGTQVASVLIGTAADDPSGDGWDPMGGYGRVDAPRAVAQVKPVPTATRKITAANISPEPIVAGATATVTSTARSLYTDGAYRATPAGTPFTVRFRKSGTSTFTAVKQGKVGAGGAVSTTVQPTADGYWRVDVGSATSGADYLDVLTPTSARRVSAANVSPEPVRYGTTATLTASTTTRYSDGRYRATPVGTTWRAQFRQRGTTTWITVTGGKITTAGKVRVTVRPARDGSWRIAVVRTAGAADYLDVTR
jgi:subtilisin family serine protease